jgi:hypothetical protein
MTSARLQTIDWSFDRRLAREAVFIAIFCLLMLVLPPSGRLEDLASSVHLTSRSELMRVQEREFTRWSLNELERRNYIRQHLTSSPPGLVMRRVPPLSHQALAWIYRAYAAMVFAALAVGCIAILVHSTFLTRVAWLLIGVSSAGIFALQTIFGWPSLFFVIYFVDAVHLFFAAYAIAMLKVLREIDDRTVKASRPPAAS